MGISIMRLATLWLVASAETFRVHGASAAAQGAKGVQGRDSAKSKGLSKKQQRAAAAAAAKEVCSVNDSPATCRELTAKYRGGAATTGGGDAMSLNVIKMLLQMCLTTLNVACWLVPMKIRSFVESKRAISMANAFSGGVFLSLAFGEVDPRSPSTSRVSCGDVSGKKRKKQRRLLQATPLRRDVQANAPRSRDFQHFSGLSRPKRAVSYARVFTCAEFTRTILSRKR
ncbi:unnamed protein product [Scytosiphon promiscuus]